MKEEPEDTSIYDVPATASTNNHKRSFSDVVERAQREKEEFLRSRERRMKEEEEKLKSFQSLDALEKRVRELKRELREKEVEPDPDLWDELPGLPGSPGSTESLRSASDLLCEFFGDTEVSGNMEKERTVSSRLPSGHAIQTMSPLAKKM